MHARKEALASTIVAVAALLCGCADLALNADRIPTEMTLSPDSVLLTVGEPTKLQFIVKDQNGRVMSVPGWAPPRWWLSDTVVAGISRDGTLTGKWGGRVDVTARLANLMTHAHFRMNPKEILLSAPVIYLNQVAQNRNGTVPLIAGRPALLRVFVVGDQINWLEAPSVRVTLLQGNDVVFERLLPPETDHILTTVDESGLEWSYDAEVPGSVIQPGVRMVVELDPEGVVPLAPGSQVRYPADGSMELDVVEPPLYRIILVPTISLPAPDSSVFDWTDGMNTDSEQMRLSGAILPVGEMEVEVRETYTTSLNLRYFLGWSRLKNEIALLYEQEGRRGYYYGVASQRLMGVVGSANIAYPVSVGADVDYIHTHEVGHTMNLWHASCSASSPREYKYPYSDGSIGVWGYDIAKSRLLDPRRYKDVMGYCWDDVWISDFHFNRALDHRLDGDGGIDHDSQPATAVGKDRGEVLVVWGGVHDGRLMLEPALMLNGPVVLPEAGGPYRVEGLGAGGETEFAFSFSPTPLAYGGGSFVFFIPYEPEWAGNLERIVLTGPEGKYTLTHDSEPRMAVVTDRSTGRIQAIIRDWNGEPLPGEATANVATTRGIPTGGLR